MAEIPGKPVRRPGTTVTTNRRVGSGIRPATDTGDAPRQAVRRPGRMPAQAPAGIPTSYKIIAGAVVVLTLVAVIGYAPFMRFWHTRAIDGAATLDERKNAATALFERRDGAAYRVFEQRLSSKDPLARDASAFGMGLIAGEGHNMGQAAIEGLTSALKDLDNPGKISFAGVLGDVSKYLNSPAAAEKDPETVKSGREMLAKGLLPVLANPDAAVRGAAIDALSEVRAPGVCAALLNLAVSDSDAALKTKARAALPATALPDAVGGLIKAMTSDDAELAKPARIAFARVRDGAKSDDLLPLVTDPNENVRREIIAALGKRKDDAKAADGIAKGLKDKLPELRILAVKSVPVSGVAGGMTQLLPLITDEDEDVRVAAADTLGELRDPESQKVLLEAFGTNPSGKTLDACMKALGKRSNGKDLSAVAVVMTQLEKHPDSIASMSAALVSLTNAGFGPRRDAERRLWDLAKWHSWWVNISKREKIKTEAMAKLDSADKRGKVGNDKKIYPELFKITNEGLEMLETCKEMCKPDDPEDVNWFDKTQALYQRNRELFFKHQELDLRK